MVASNQVGQAPRRRSALLLRRLVSRRIGLQFGALALAGLLGGVAAGCGNGGEGDGEGDEEDEDD